MDDGIHEEIASDGIQGTEAGSGERIGDNHLRWRNAGVNGTQPRVEEGPGGRRNGDHQVLCLSLTDNAGLDEKMTNMDVALDGVAAVGRLALKMFGCTRRIA